MSKKLVLLLTIVGKSKYFIWGILLFWIIIINNTENKHLPYNVRNHQEKIQKDDLFVWHDLEYVYKLI